MIQFFIKPSVINEQNWQMAYEKICSIVSNFPTKLYRLESYNGFSPELDKKHLDVFVDKGTENEHLSFYGDWMSYTGGRNVRFYKSWEQQLEKASYLKEIDTNKPAAWFPHQDYKNDGSVPEGNGIMPYSYYYINPEGAHQIYPLIAIGILFENLFKDAAFMTVRDETEATIDATHNWMESHFQQSFTYPLYFNKIDLLQLLVPHYTDKKDVAYRFAHLYRQQHKQNMEFLIPHLSYDTTFAFYTEVLADTSFGTFGFNDVLMPWIAVTKDLENTIDLVMASKAWLLKDKNNTRNIDKAAKYDLTYILEQVLNQYILWTPRQREQLAHFYTNKEALETGEEDLFGSIRRMMGYRVDICPMYSNKKELFESFMYKAPKQAKQFKAIIDNWLVENEGAYEKLKVKLEQTYNDAAQIEEIPEKERESIAQKIEWQNRVTNFVSGFKPTEQYFVKAAITTNPTYLKLEEAVEKLKQDVLDIINSEEHKSYVNKVRQFEKERNIEYIRYRVKKIKYAVHPDFENWLQEANNDSVLFYLQFLMALKIYTHAEHFTRSQILWDKDRWVNWL